MIVARMAMSDLESKESLLWWQKAGLQYSRMGYGGHIPTRHMVKLPGNPRWRRVYCACNGNAATCYVTDKEGNWIVID